MSFYLQPTETLFDIAEEIETPALIYDFASIQHAITQVAGDIALVQHARLNIALKACHNPTLLRFIAALGLGCDVASMGELVLARKAGFTEITTTGPAFAERDFRAFHEAGVTVDLDSVSQIEAYGRLFPVSDVGLRVRIPLPKAMESDATFGADSRFGVQFGDQELVAALTGRKLTVKRLHVHTGQMTPEAMLFKAKYLLAIAEMLESIEMIDLGGGLFHFFTERSKARQSLLLLDGLVSEFSRRTGRTLQIRFEPGGALLGPCGYLVCEVRAVSMHTGHNQRLVTVDASAWNLAPWHKPQIFVVPAQEGERLPGLVAGNTLYEGDFFGRDVLGRQAQLEFEACAPGDRLVIANIGAYTMTNSRRFNRIPPPREYSLLGTELRDISPAAEYFFQ